QHMKVNEKKIQYYAYLTKIYQKQQNKVPILLFFTISDCREKKLESEAIKYGVYLQTYLLQNVL
ncbi:replication-relaxation family protein, partial [Bacillus sp. D-CC]